MNEHTTKSPNSAPRSQTEADVTDSVEHTEIADDERRASAPADSANPSTGTDPSAPSTSQGDTTTTENLQNDPEHSLLTAALEYANRGWAVHPLHTVVDGLCSCGKNDCDHPGKHPRTPHGYKEASTDTQKIREWWTEYPDANIGIATGQDSKLLVVDLDDPIAEKLMKALGAPNSPIVQTGDGKHIYYQYPDEDVGSITGFLPEMDTRGRGGYIIAPPSQHENGTSYQWLRSPDEVGLAMPPKWLTDLNASPARKQLKECLEELAEAVLPCAVSWQAGAASRADCHLP